MSVTPLVAVYFVQTGRCPRLPAESIAVGVGSNRSASIDSDFPYPFPFPCAACIFAVHSSHCSGVYAAPLSLTAGGGRSEMTAFGSDWKSVPGCGSPRE